MTIINETQHPAAVGLFATLSEGPGSYECLIAWRRIRGLSEEKAADLYARIEEAFSGLFGATPTDEAVTMLSRALWQNDAAVPA